jgi:hypothetical protein
MTKKCIMMESEQREGSQILPEGHPLCWLAARLCIARNLPELSNDSHEK